MDKMHKDIVPEIDGSRSSEQSRLTDLRIVAAIPCFNNGQSIGEIVSKAKKHVDQVIIIDDGSSDGTSKLAEEAGASVTRHTCNRGYGLAIKSCFESAKAIGADVLVILDGDGQHSPDELLSVITPIVNKNADLVIGSRFIGREGKMPRYRKFGINVITFLCNFGSKVKVSDSQSGFRAYGKRVLDSVLPTERGMSASVQILLQAVERGFVITEVPINCFYPPTPFRFHAVTHGVSVATAAVRLRLKSFCLQMASRFRRR
ncbi:glycosyltransferase family 2 protein [Chloroflexota bacterium]